MLFESSRPALTVISTKDEIIASFVDGKFASDDPKTIKILLATEGVEEAKHFEDINGDEAFDGNKFNNKVERLNEKEKKSHEKADSYAGEIEANDDDSEANDDEKVG